MSFTFKGGPQFLAPVFNPMYFYVDSTNKTQPGFKYTAIMTDLESSEEIASFKVFPRPVDGYGVFDVHQVLQSQVSFDLLLGNRVTGATGSYVAYNIDFGEEYIYEWAFSADTIAGTSYVKLLKSGGTANPAFVAGDLIDITLIPIAYPNNPVIGGVHRVISVSTTAVTIDVLSSLIIPSANQTGTIRYSNNRKIETLALEDAAGIAFNGAISHKDFPSYDANEYNLFQTNPIYGAGHVKMLTDMPIEGYHVRLENDMYLNGFSVSWVNTDWYDIITDYGRYRYSADVLPVNSAYTKTFPIGPNNIINTTATATTVSGSLPIFKNTSWDFFTNDNDGGFVRFSGTTTIPTGYTVGQNVKIVQNVGYTNSSYNGLHTIVSATTNSITINVPYGTVAPNEAGVATQIVDNYSFEVQPNYLSPLSYTYNFVIDDYCSRYDNVELLFLDRMGSFIPVNFQLQSSRKISIDKSEYQSILGNFSASLAEWSYTSLERGRHQINTTITEELTINSNWVTEDESVYLQQLASSPEVYIRENGEWWPVILKERDYDVTIKNNKKNIRLTMKIEYANNSRVQTF